jgi:hypothetical protein
MSSDPWVWVAAFLTLCILTFLYKDNPFFKFAEHLLVGVSLGYIISIYYHNAFIPKVWDPLLKQEFRIVIPALLGLLSFSILVPKYSWLVRYPIAFTIGVWSGLTIPRNFQGLIFEQVQGTMITTLSLSGVIMVIGVITTVVYFYFSAEHKGTIGNVAHIGIWFIMLAFGAAFGYTVMARVSLLIGRMQFLLHDWLGVIH